MASKSPLILKGLSKFYGDEKGIENINLTVEAGEVFGFLGANGAGKSTTIRTILNFISPTQGSIEIFGLDSKEDTTKIKHRIGYLSGDAELYRNMTGQQLLTYLASFGNHVDWNYVDQLVEKLQAQPHKKIDDLSKGNRQKIALIQAFMHKPDLLILDEPTNGLDPLMQQIFYEIVLSMKKLGKTIFLSSHNLVEVQKICDRAAFIRDGNLLAIEEISSFRNLNFHKYIIEFADAPDIRVFDSQENIKNVTKDNNTITLDVSGSVDTCIKLLAQYEVLAIDEEETTLEDI
ncbi:ATP-binding cassette domain-containing protein, partial [candidate division WWE3 bacterium]|nr:ATP-binding cassette domain-containing protein [candidate division WWE3 bacterium]